MSVRANFDSLKTSIDVGRTPATALNLASDRETAEGGARTRALQSSSCFDADPHNGSRPSGPSGHVQRPAVWRMPHSHDLACCFRDKKTDPWLRSTKRLFQKSFSSILRGSMADVLSIPRFRESAAVVTSPVMVSTRAHMSPPIASLHSLTFLYTFLYPFHITQKSQRGFPFCAIRPNFSF